MRMTSFGLLALAAAICGTATASMAEQQREVITLPADAKAILLAQMLGHIVGLDAVIAALGRGDYETAGEVAGSELGTSRFQEGGAGQDQGPDLGIGQYLPERFRAMSRDFRESANAFAALAREMPEASSAEQQQDLLASLAKVTKQCRLCHDAYRVE